MTTRTAAANAARMRKSEERWAEHLRTRGWGIVPPGVVKGLRKHGVEHQPDEGCQWCIGYAQALSDVLADTPDVS